MDVLTPGTPPAPEEAPIAQVLPLRSNITRELLDVLLNTPESKRILAAYAEAAGVPPTAELNIATNGMALLVPAGIALEPIGFQPQPPPDDEARFAEALAKVRDNLAKEAFLHGDPPLEREPPERPMIPWTGDTTG